MGYTSLAEVVEAKRAGTLPEGFRLWITGDYAQGGVGHDVMYDQIIDGALADALAVLGLDVEDG